MASTPIDISVGFQAGSISLQGDGTLLINTLTPITPPNVSGPINKTGAGGRLSPHQEKFFTAVLGVTEVSVFRQGDLKRDRVKYKVYYNERDGDRTEVAFNVSLEELELSGGSQEWYVVGRAIQAILDSR